MLSEVDIRDVSGNSYEIYCSLSGVKLISEPILTSSLISNYIHDIVWDEITYPFRNFKGATVEVLELISNSIPHFTGDVITNPGWD